MSEASVKEFGDKLKSALDRKNPLAIFRKPDESEVWLYTMDETEKNRFLMHSFDSKTEKSVWDAYPVSLPEADFDFNFHLELEKSSGAVHITKENHIRLVKETIEATRKGDIPKIVIARTKEVPNPGFHLLNSFKNLLKLHKSATVWLWHNPGQETWIGATPELLLHIKGNEINTVALAGTRHPEDKWTKKEYEEQQFVTDFILDCLRDGEEVEVRGPETIVAGKLRHLKSYIKGKLTKDLSTKMLLKRLHPTPAVCGKPKKESFEFIINNESFDREFYTGYIGVETPVEQTYYVNLRCARIFEDSVRLFVGGGILADSDSVKEWEETELKSGTILNALT